MQYYFFYFYIFFGRHKKKEQLLVPVCSFFNTFFDNPSWRLNHFDISKISLMHLGRQLKSNNLNKLNRKTPTSRHELRFFTNKQKVFLIIPY